jgi:hypothetical protein
MNVITTNIVILKKTMRNSIKIYAKKTHLQLR